MRAVVGLLVYVAAVTSPVLVLLLARTSRQRTPMAAASGQGRTPPAPAAPEVRKPRHGGPAAPLGSRKTLAERPTRKRPMEPTDDEVLPVPPPFMFGCGDRTKLLLALAGRVIADADCFAQQLAVAKHIAAAHPDDVPVPHTRRCEQYPEYRALPDAADAWAEHRARDLFLPEAVARLM